MNSSVAAAFTWFTSSSGTDWDSLLPLPNFLSLCLSQSRPSIYFPLLFLLLHSHDTTKCFKKSTRPLGGDNWYATYQNNKKKPFWVHIVSFFWEGVGLSDGEIKIKAKKTKCVNKKWSLDVGCQWGWVAVECHVTNEANKGQNELRCRGLLQIINVQTDIQS